MNEVVGPSGWSLVGLTVALFVGVPLFIWPGLVIAARNAIHRRLHCPACSPSPDPHTPKRGS